MEVDTETGAVKIRKYVAVDDIGKVVNPMIVEGQVHGGLTQGIAQALFEEAVYDENGTLTTGSFVDYLVPTAPDLIDFVTDRTESPAVSNELGAKGVGEAGTIASTPAIVNGILDALRPLGVKDIEMPCTPMRVWKAIRRAELMTDDSATPAEAQPHFHRAAQGDASATCMIRASEASTSHTGEVRHDPGGVRLPGPDQCRRGPTAARRGR